MAYIKSGFVKVYMSAACFTMVTYPLLPSSGDKNDVQPFSYGRVVILVQRKYVFNKEITATYNYVNIHICFTLFHKH